VVTFTGAFTRFVKPGLRWYLVAAGALLLVLAVGAGVRAWQERSADSSGEDGHHREGHVPAVGWLMAAPVLVLILVGPPSLGGFAADRDVSLDRLRRQYLGAVASPVDGASPISFTDIYERLRYAPETLRGRPVRLVGRVLPTADGTPGFVALRFYASCCAADAIPLKVRVHSDAPSPGKDTWVEVVGVVRAPSGPLGDAEHVRPELDATSVRRVGQPANPYEG
jgi:uncharacterized repeat protein (TIGR03943 family)